MAKVTVVYEIKSLKFIKGIRMVEYKSVWKNIYMYIKYKYKIDIVSGTI